MASATPFVRPRRIWETVSVPPIAPIPRATSTALYSPPPPPISAASRGSIESKAMVRLQCSPDQADDREQAPISAHMPCRDTHLRSDAHHGRQHRGGTDWSPSGLRAFRLRARRHPVVHALHFNESDQKQQRGEGEHRTSTQRPEQRAAEKRSNHARTVL